MLSTLPKPDLRIARAQWLSRSLIALPREFLPHGLDPARCEWRLTWASEGRLDLWAPEPVPWHSSLLTHDRHGPTLQEQHINGRVRDAVVLRLPHDVAVQAEHILMAHTAVAAYSPSGRLVNATGLQIAGVLDDIYASARQARLGVSWRNRRPTLRLWAPTARLVELLLWPASADLSGPPEVLPLSREADGCWSIVGSSSWREGRYRYRVTVFAPSFQRVVTNTVSDPYSVALTLNSTHSVIADLEDPRLAPDLWTSSPSPALRSLVDQVIYELHVRDFSWHDKSVPPELRGTYAAFAIDSDGTRHLRRLSDAGLTTVELLPVFDNATVEEDRARQRIVEKQELHALPPDSNEQQRRIAATKVSVHNWGYDPWHYQAPEGSYATAGASDVGRIAEFRSMVGGLHSMGLRVVLDQVFNHTARSGQDLKSVLDRIVPGYFHRLDALGRVEESTCCANVATENAMAEKLMVDSCVLWAKHYRIDGFRFDLMGHHSRDNMLAIRAALDALTLDKDGVDGRAITMHGEGWNFGEVANNAYFIQATQGQLGGTRIATFSDRLRDGVRGGSPFDADPRGQGFGTGLMTAPNTSEINGNGFEQRDRLLYYTDLIQLGMAGNLRRFTFVSALRGVAVRGDEIDFNWQRAGYADSPDEVLTYVDAHDNETLFDALTLKLHVMTTMAERVRMNTLCLAIATLSQTPVLWHAGTDILRTKNLDRNSYASGDWFNYIDFSLTHNGFGAGLPPEGDNAPKWPYLAPLLANRELKPSAAAIRQAHAMALDLLRLRFSTPLFRLGDTEQILAKLSFPVSGSWLQIPGVIVMVIDDRYGRPVDPTWSAVAVVINATPRLVHQRVPGMGSEAWVLSPVHQSGSDEVVRESCWRDGGFEVPGRTVAVFGLPR